MYTFDVFDTLITRTTATPVGIFTIIQQKLIHECQYKHISSYIKQNFYYLRINAEKLARYNYCKNGIEDVTLEQIYEAISMTGCISPEEAKQISKLEKMVEIDNVIGIEENIDKIKGLMDKGEQVVLISDMYLDHYTIKEMLIKTDEVFEKIKLYVSSVYKKCKWSGNLYKIVCQQEKADYQNWTHFGDNYISDVKKAKALGIRAYLFPYEQLNEMEKKALFGNEQDYFMQLTIGTLRNVRLIKKLNKIATIGCSIGGSILFPYIWWVLQESICKGIKRLYFIARDGYVLKKIADIIINKLNYPIETNYIYGSRLSWRLPSISQNNINLKKLMRWSYTNKMNSVEDLANFFEVGVDDLIQHIPERYRNMCDQLSRIDIYEIVSSLNENQDFLEFLIETQNPKRELVINYLLQEVDIQDNAFAFVELAGTGFTQGCLADIISDIYPYSIRTFFFKLDKMNIMKNCIYYDFLPSFLYLNVIIEMLCRAPHGQTIGYKEKKGKIIPVIEKNEGHALIQHGFEDYVLGIEKFTEQYCTTIKQNALLDNKIKLLLHCMEYITKTPNNEIVAFFGSMPFSASERENKIVEFAPILSKRHIIKIFLWRTYEPISQYYQGTYIEYSIMRGTDFDKQLIKICKKIKKSYVGKIITTFKKIINPNSKYTIATDFTCELIGDKIVLYAAGKLGQELYKKISKHKSKSIVQWVDKDYRKYQEMGFKVVSSDDIGKIEYDNIVVGVLDKKISQQIIKLLIDKGIPREKIVWINLRPTWDC